MIDSLTSMIDEISNRDETCFIEIVTETASHHRSVTIMKSSVQ